MMTTAVVQLISLFLFLSLISLHSAFALEQFFPVGNDTSSTPEDNTVGGQTEAGLKPLKFDYGGREHFYQLPAGKAKGLVAVFPGCVRSVHGFWPYSSNKDFLGFPEDVSHTKQILKKGYAILVLTPTDLKELCWSAKTDGWAADAVRLFQDKFNLNVLYLMGASSGGGLIQRMVASGGLKARGIIAEVATTAEPSAHSPQTVWVVMSDAKEQQTAEGRVLALKGLGQPAAMLISQKRAVIASYFSDQMAAITPARSANIREQLIKIGLIDASGKFKADPKSFPWEAKLAAALPWLNASPATNVKNIHSSGIFQALLSAYSHHEHTAPYTTAILTWFESNGKGDLSNYVNSMIVLKPAYFSLV